MPSPFSLITDLENMADVHTEIKEHRTHSPESCYGEVIKLAPSQRREVRARKFHQRRFDCSRNSVLKIFVGGVDTGRQLMPFELIDYSKIVFKLDKGRNLVIVGFRDTSSSFPMSRIKGLRFLVSRTNNYEEDIFP